MSGKIEMVDEKFGRLTVIRENGRKYSQVAWECRCDCGNITTVCGASLRNGDSQSCGCLQKEIASRETSTEAKIKMSEAKKSKPLPVEHRKKISIATKGKNNPNYGKHFSKEVRAKMSKSAMGRRASKEAREKMSQSHKGMRGKSHSEETRARMSKIRKSKKLKGLFTGKLSYNWKGGKTFAVFDTLAPRISWCNDVRRNPNDKAQLQTTCALCNKWFCPTKSQIYSRLTAINNKQGDGNFYCSDECKSACPVYKKVKFRAGEAPSQDRPGQKEWRKHVIVCAEYTCERCGKIFNEKDLFAHHIKAVAQQPIESMDIDNGMALCKDCHKIVHSETGCRPVDLRCQP
jgi:hypothetical protein